MFHRVLVANRGEIARRVIRTLSKLGIESVVVFSEADKEASYVEEATHRVALGPSNAKQSYLNENALLQAALQYDCEAIHPGFGFLSENAIFATRCARQKLSFIGPTPHSIAIMGDKAVARSTMTALGIPTLSGSDGVIESLDEAKARAADVGYPVLLKARSGGGGKGMRLVASDHEMEEAFLEASREAQASFNDGKLYLEKFIKNARHIEFQVLGDHYGKVICLGERECSVQRRNQKLLEEAPANNFSADLRERMIQIINPALSKMGYRNAGTLEFLLNDAGQLYFMEMNTRIQVEHGVTELITGVDIVEWQVRIAANEPLTLNQEDIAFNGHALECRINAEDVHENFIPRPGKLTKLSLPKNSVHGPVRIDTHVSENFVVAPYYDSMLAKVLTHANSRSEAILLMEAALKELHVEGVPTTIDFHRAILGDSTFRAGTYDCSFLEKNLARLLAKEPS